MTMNVTNQCPFVFAHMIESENRAMTLLNRLSIFLLAVTITESLKSLEMSDDGTFGTLVIQNHLS